MRCEYFLQGSDGCHAASFEEDDVGRHAPDLGKVVRNVQHGDIESQQAGEDVVCGGVIEPSQWLVEEENLGCRRQGSRQGYALAFSAGELRRRLIGQSLGAKEAEHLANTCGTAVWIEMANSEGDVLARGEMREERGLLGDQADGTAAGRDGDATLGIEEVFSSQLEFGLPPEG